MKKILIALLLLVAQTNRAQDCKTRASNKPSESVRFPDAYTPPGDGPKVTINVAKLKPQLTVAEYWVKGILKYFTGAKLAYSNNYYFDLSTGSLAGEFFNGSGIKGSYSAQMRFYAYYCYDNNDKIFTEDESGSSIEIYFNNVFVPALTNTVGVFGVNEKPAFELLEKTKTEGRIDYYDQIGMSNDYDTIYKSKNEYLKQLLKDVEKYKSREIASAKEGYTPANEADNKGRFDAELKRIDNSKNYTAEQMAPYRKRFIETWETEKQKFDKKVAKIESETNEAKEVLLEYLRKPQEWLNHSFKHFYSGSSYTGKGMRQYLDGLDVFTDSSGEETRTYVASLNPAYFNKSLGAEVPQLIMLVLGKHNYPHMKKVAELIHKTGALTQLQNILTPGKQPVEQP